MLVWAKNSSKIGTELKAVMIQIKEQKNSQENVKNRLFEFLEEFYQYYGYHHKPQVFKTTDDGFENLRGSRLKIRDNEADNGEFEERESMLAIEDIVAKKKLCEMEQQQVFHEKEADKVTVGEQDRIT
ncbi:hypothetical protein Q3G72_012138 [Acer saccharum]|nr:hypothetical protein Q3G72_012138 [Acer saccharum]